jgi:hypothetical protein
MFTREGFQIISKNYCEKLQAILKMFTPTMASLFEHLSGHGPLSTKADHKLFLLRLT